MNQKQLSKYTSKSKENSYSDSSKSLQINISTHSEQKNKKRNRRCKSLAGPRNFTCPNCLRNYLSAFALKNHRKVKHEVEFTKKGRGWSEKEFLEEDYVEKMNIEYENFMENKTKLKTEKEANIFFYITRSKRGILFYV